MTTYYAPLPPRIERVASPERLTALGFNILEVPEGSVVAVIVSTDPPQVEGVYTPAEFYVRFAPLPEPTA